MQIAAAGVVEAADRLLIGLRQIVEDGVAVGVILGLDGIGLQPEVQDGRARDCHLRHSAGVRLEEFEMLDHRVIGKPDLAVDANGCCPALDAVELDAVVKLAGFHAVKHAEEVEMPKRAAELAVGRNLQPDLLLLFDDRLDLAVLDLLELSRIDLALVPLAARFLQARRAQQASDHVGAKRRLVSRHWHQAGVEIAAMTTILQAVWRRRQPPP